MKPGQDATLQVWRKARPSAGLSVRITELKDQLPTAANQATPCGHGAGQPRERLGLTVRAHRRREASAQCSVQGGCWLRKSAVLPLPPKLSLGDVILGVNGKRVNTTQELQEAARSAGKNVALLVQREDAQIFIPLRLP